MVAIEQPIKLNNISFHSNLLSKNNSFANPNTRTAIGATIIPNVPKNSPICVNHPDRNRCKNLSTPILLANLLKNSIIE
jgi:hypothetical protein